MIVVSLTVKSLVLLDAYHDCLVLSKIAKYYLVLSGNVNSRQCTLKIQDLYGDFVVLNSVRVLVNISFCIRMYDEKITIFYQE
jgi:hypothetical protein